VGKNLNNKQLRFIEEYLVDLNGTQAAIRAGYSERSARTTSANLMANPAIQAKIQTKKQERAERTDITADRVVLELAKVAFTNMRDVCSWSPDSGVTLHDSEKIGDKAHGAVLKVKERYNIDDDGGPTGRTLEIQLHDKLKALEMLGKHLGMWDGSGNKPTDDKKSHIDSILAVAAKVAGRK